MTYGVGLRTHSTPIRTVRGQVMNSTLWLIALGHFMVLVVAPIMIAISEHYRTRGDK